MAKRPTITPGAHGLTELSEACRSDIDRFESTALVGAGVAGESIDTFTGLFAEALAAGCVRPTNTIFLAQCLRQLTAVTRDMALLPQAGLTPEQALLEIDKWIWDGLTIEC